MRHYEWVMGRTVVLDNREIATLAWLGVMAAFALWRREVRRGAVDLLRLAPHWKISAPLVVFTTYVAGLVMLARELGLWDTGLIAQTTVWFVGTGTVLLFSAHRASEPGFFRRTALKTVEVAVITEFFLNLFVFHLAIEFVLVPFLFVLVGMSVVAGGENRYAPAKRFVDSLLALTGLCVAAYVVYRVTTDWSEIDIRDTVSGFATPVWLTLGAMPFIYLLGAIATYESTFVRVDFASEDTKSRRRVKLALIWVLKLDLADVAAFAGRWPRDASEAPTFAETTRAIREFQTSKREEATRIAVREARLVQFAGVRGEDDEGHRLDQRDFKETRDALQLLASAQMGWYHNDGRYRSDLLFALEPQFIRIGLPSHEISMEISADGQMWWAWRRTVSGWCFAIGSSAPPPDQWLFDGPEPPQGFPSDDVAWGARWGIDANNW